MNSMGLDHSDQELSAAKQFRGEDMKSTWKAVAAALVLIASLAWAQDAPAPSPAPDKTASDKATSDKPAAPASDKDTSDKPAAPASDKDTSDKPAAAASASPAGPEYVIGPEDVLHIAVWRENDLTATLPVRPDGKISLPLLDDVQASGLTPKQLADSVTEKLRKYIADPRVTVVVTTINSKRIYLVGEVLHPGATSMLPNMTVLQALSSAGLSQFAKTKGIYVLRTE